MGDIKTYNINTIENAQFFTQSDDYQSLTSQMAKQQQRIARLQKVGDTEGAIEEAAELEALEKRLDDLKENVFRLYEIFTKIEINTERLVKAKAYFEQGQFREADAILNAEAMTQDLERVIERDQQLDQDYAHQKADIAQHRTQLADEFLIKARLQALTYDQADWFERACEYFETALKAARNLTTVFEYALFLQKHNCLDQAKPFYQEVLEINRALAAENPRTYLPYVATTLINVSIYYLQANPDAERSIALATEALELLQDFQDIPAFERYIMTALQVLQANGVDLAQANPIYKGAFSEANAPPLPSRETVHRCADAPYGAISPSSTNQEIRLYGAILIRRGYANASCTISAARKLSGEKRRVSPSSSHLIIPT